MLVLQREWWWIVYVHWWSGFGLLLGAYKSSNISNLSDLSFLLLELVYLKRLFVAYDVKIYNEVLVLPFLGRPDEKQIQEVQPLLQQQNKQESWSSVLFILLPLLVNTQGSSESVLTDINNYHSN